MQLVAIRLVPVGRHWSAFTVVYLLLSFAVGMASWTFIEEPAMRLRDRFHSAANSV